MKPDFFYDALPRKLPKSQISKFKKNLFCWFVEHSSPENSSPEDSSPKDSSFEKFFPGGGRFFAG
jgi:hypothetical protein